jgi:hypothetical protein
MMQIEQIVQMESDKLELSGLFHERSQEPVKGLLLYLYTAVDIWMLLSPDDRRSVRNFNEFFEKERVVKLFLKELKSKKNKEKTAPAPHRKEKTIKEKSQKTRHSDVRAKLDLEERKKAFWNELLEYEGKYGRKMLLKFFYYWAEEMEDLDLMKWEVEKANKSFNIKYRLGIWSKRSYETDDQAADIHLERVKGKKSAKAAVNTSEQKAAAAEREAADVQREAATAKAKAESITMEEYLKNNPDSILRTLKKND